MKLSFTKKLLAALVLGAAMTAGCGPGPVIVGDAVFDMTNDTYDTVDVYIGGAYMDTIAAGETHSYDMGLPATYNVTIFKAGTQELLNSVDTFFAEGVTTWDVYDNAPVVLVQNNYDNSGEAVDVFVDGQAVSFAIENPGQQTAFDATILPGETGFYLVEIATHRVEVFGTVTNDLYHDDTRTYLDADHVTFLVP
ncbi:MAG: hypothetical protein HY075_10895 [Deltaproteobacteria bacterium]|nr:hypothetical protein [Deltaproteobacteria bacterium]